MGKIPVTHVGSGARRFSLELRGRVLVIEFKNWIGHATTYVPAERVTAEHARHRNGQLPLRSWTSVLLYLPIITLVVLLLQSLSARDGLEALPSTAISGFLALTFLGVVIYAVGATIRFLLWPQRTVRLRVATDEGANHLEFYRPESHGEQLDALVTQIQGLSSDEANESLMPLHLAFTRQHVKPFRLTLARAAYTTVLLTLLLFAGKYAWEHYGETAYVVSPMVYSVVLLPLAWYAAGYSVQRYFLSREPAAFRKAVHHLYREEYDLAEADFEKTVEQVPEHEPALRLLTELLAQRGDFDGAFARCAQLARFRPEEAEALQGDLWALKRITAHMES